MRCCVKSGDHHHGAVNVCVRYYNMYNGQFHTDLHVPNMFGDFFHRGSSLSNFGMAREIDSYKNQTSGMGRTHTDNGHLPKQGCPLWIITLPVTAVVRMAIATRSYPRR